MPINVNGFSCTLADGVRETTQTTGTGTYSLDGAATVDGVTYETFIAGLGDGVRTVYTARLGSDRESGIGTITAGAPDSLTRDSILSSTNGGNAVNWGPGVKDIMCAPVVAMLHSLQDQIDTVPVAATKTTVRTTSGTFTTDAKCLYAWVRIVGGGGGGGGTPATGAGQHSEGGGGGGGEYREGHFTAAQLGASQTVTIGAGGTVGSGDPGGTGGTTSFGALMTAIGGTGGTVGIATSGQSERSGGSGGTGGTGGSFRVQGDRGGFGIVRNGLFTENSHGGGSVLAGLITGDATAGRDYGGGGSGAFAGSETAAKAGGAGGGGIAIIVEYLHR